MAHSPLVYDRVLEEVGQGHTTRKELFDKLESTWDALWSRSLRAFAIR